MAPDVVYTAIEHDEEVSDVLQHNTNNDARQVAESRRTLAGQAHAENLKQDVDSTQCQRTDHGNNAYLEFLRPPSEITQTSIDAGQQGSTNDGVRNPELETQSVSIEARPLHTHRNASHTEAQGAASSMDKTIMIHESKAAISSDTLDVKPDTRSRIFRQVWLIWLSLLLTTASVVVTLLYASHPTIFSNVDFATRSISRPIRALRILSAVSDILLSATFSAVLERTQWLLTFKKRSMTLAEYLSLHVSTSCLGLCNLALGKGGVEVYTRMVSLLRLLVMAVLAILGVIIMSDVHSIQSYEHIHSGTLPAGAGISEFNKTLAYLWSPEADLTIGSKLNTFLQSDEIAVDVTPRGIAGVTCDQISYSRTEPTCAKKVFMPGQVPVDLIMEDGFVEADILNAFSMQGYMLSFGGGDVNGTWKFDDETECRTYGIAGAAVRVCIRNTRKNTLFARMVKCPRRIAYSTQGCLSNTDWHNITSDAVSTSLSTAFAWADVAFHRANGSIASVQMNSRAEEDADIRGMDLLDVYSVLSKGSASLLDLITNRTGDNSAASASGSDDTTDNIAGLFDGIGSPSLTGFDELGGLSEVQKRQSLDDDSLLSTGILGSLFGGAMGSAGAPGSSPLFPIVPFATLEACSITGTQNSRFPSYCTNFLQNFLASPLFWCHRLLPVRTTRETAFSDFVGLDSAATDASLSAAMDDLMAQLGVDKASMERLAAETTATPFALSRSRYLVRVDPTSLLLYAIFAGGILLFCFTALVVGCWEDLEYGPFPLLDFHRRLEVCAGVGGVPVGSEHETHWSTRKVPKRAALADHFVVLRG